MSNPHAVRVGRSLCLIGALACGVWCAAQGVEAAEFQATAQAKILPPDSKVEMLWNEGSFTEGPVLAQDGAILFSDIGQRIMRFDPKTKQTTVFREPSGKANGLIFDRSWQLIAAEGAGGGNRRVSLTAADGKVRALADRFEGKKFNSPNDVAVDSGGRVYFTDPRYGGAEPRELDFEGVFLVDAQGAVQLATKDVQKPNGILVSQDDKTLFVADNNSDPKGNHQLVAFPIQAGGALGAKRVLFDFGPDRRGIDGMALDVEGNIYATAGRGERAGIYVFDPAGNNLAFIPTPGDPTNCEFSGGDEANVLYITGAGPAGTGKYALYRVRLAVRGWHPTDRVR